MPRPDTGKKLNILKHAIFDKLPYVWGTTPLLPESKGLFFNRNGNSGYLNLSKPDNSQIERLAQICEPATFGRNNEDILDEGYRKAGKLNVDNFAMNIDLARMRLPKIIQSGLLSAQDEGRPIIAELYKLNVYGPGSFFKAHKDTPRSESMFGSLVLVLPVPHEGGELVLRKGDTEWAYDSAKILSEQNQPSIGYVAFYGDIEHEVLPVKSGYRITLTYNLFFDNAPVVPPIAPAKQTAFEAGLSQLLQDRSFLTSGGFLGYSLQYQYPIPTKDRFKSDVFDRIVGNLKGVDALVHHVCTTLGLKFFVMMVYDLPKVVHFNYSNPPTHILMTSIPCIDWQCEDLYDTLVEQYNGLPARAPNLSKNEDNDEDEDKDKDKDKDSQRRDGRPKPIDIWWLNKPSVNNSHETPYIAYGNEATLSFMYGNFSFLIVVGPASNRTVSR